MPNAPRQTGFSLRRILVVSLLLFALLPAALVTWLLARSSAQSVGDLANQVVSSVAIRIQAETENHLQQPHEILNGLFPATPTQRQTVQARQWLERPALFEPMAFALTRQMPGVPFLYLATVKGNFFGVEQTERGAVVVTREVRDGQQNQRRFYLAAQPGDRAQALTGEGASYEPRTRVWYESALRAGGRVFAPVTISPLHKQLVITLAQPVYDDFSGAAGVFATDLHLQRLADFLRTQTISSRGAAYLVDEQGLLVATSAGDPLYRSDAGALQRVAPDSSRNPVIRASYAALEGRLRKKSSDTTMSEGFVDRGVSLSRLPMGNDALITVRRPFGDALGLRWTLVVAAPESDFTAVTQRAFVASLAVIAAVLLLGSAIAVYVAQRLGRRLEALGWAAQRLGRGEVPPVEHDTHIREVRQLSQVLHDSAVQLESYREEVRAKTATIEEANQQLEARVARRTAELESSREEALQAAKAKASFLATMSHEIRTPLNGVVGMSTLLAETRLDEEQSDYLQTIRLSSDQLLAVINDILDFSKIESGKLDLESEPLSPRNAMEEACDIAAPRAREKKLELIVDVAEGVAGVTGITGAEGGLPVAIAGDVTRIRQVLINLINNAIKFTEKGEVAVSARQLERHGERVVLEFRVSDSGIGIPPERVGALFEAFTQVDASTTRKYGGTGLGLAICKRLVELMGGDIGVESVVGQGSSFWFTVPAPLAELPALLGAFDATVLQGRHALVVDDHETNVRVLTRQLELWGMRVTSADSGAAALAVLAGAPLPDIVISDMHMPEMDGVSLARAIKAEPARAALPLVLLTSGFMPPGHEAAGLFAARLLKPTRQKQLFETVARCISSHGGVRADRGELPGAGAAARDASVLVVDDNAVNLKVAVAMLTRLGYGSETALDGQESVEAVARALAEGRRFGAVLMDVNMPRMNGLQATGEIQSLLGERSPPIIALTAAASAEDRARCMAAGMNDYLTKPLHVAALAGALERWVGREGPPPALAVAAPAEATAAAEPVLMDFERLAQFKEFDDEELSMTREVISLFRADAAAKLEAIAAAVAAGDAQALSWASHALVGAAGNVGAVALQGVGMALESAAKTGVVPADAARQIELLERYWLQTRSLLDAWL